MKAKTINRHYFFQLVFMTMLITLILLGILLYGNLVKHDEYLLQAMAVSPYAFLELSSLLIPYALSFALPFGFMLALLLCYGRWASNNEILALRSLGQGIFSWGGPCFFLSLVVSLFSLYTFLQWGPVSRAEFDQKKMAIFWSNINSLLETEKEIEFDLGEDSGNFTNQNLGTLSSEPIRKVSLSVGSIIGKKWHNLRILLLGEQGELLRIINSKSARIESSLNNSQLFLYLKNVDLESAQVHGKNNLFVSFEKWSKPLVFDLNSKNNFLNIKRVGFFKLLELSRVENEKKNEAKVLVQKGFALGTSSFFLSLILLPLSITKGRKESISNLAMGICLSVLYYASLTILEDFSIIHSNSFYLWIPNVVCFIIGSYLLYKFERVNLRKSHI
jgi:lipopolysaccharide export system permease protein